MEMTRQKGFTLIELMIGLVLMAIILTIAYLAQGLAADRIMEPSNTEPRSLMAIAVQFGAIIRDISRRVTMEKELRLAEDRGAKL